MLKSITIVLLVVLSLTIYPQRGSTEELPITLDQHLQRIFGDKAEVAKAVLIHESQGLKLDAKNWNCIYDGKSTFCKKQDRSKAWSVDCGIAQINVRGQICPAELLTLEGNMKAVEKIYKTQGLNAWVSYKTKAYLKYL